jgi:PqqD family protein of HPr-rel-A system
MRYARRKGVSETAIGEELFLVDPASGELFHLDRGARGLWTLLAEPSRLESILATFRDAFPDEAGDRLERDLRQALAQLMARGLVVTVP